MKYDIEIISAPSILGLKPTGVEDLPDSLLNLDLADKLDVQHPIIHVPDLNDLYSYERDTETKCLNPNTLKEFSLKLNEAVRNSIDKGRFALVLGGDCSILLGITSGLKEKGTYGLISLDAHADFYEPEKSISGEAADMEIGFITGRGPDLLTNIKNLKPYIQDKHLIHIGQRDQEDTKKYGSQEIRSTKIICLSLSSIESEGLEVLTTEILLYINKLDIDGFWIHFDTDVLSDDENPAVDYRLPGGLLFEQVEYVIRRFLLTGRVAGMSVTIFNPRLDKDKKISKKIAESLEIAFSLY